MGDLIQKQYSGLEVKKELMSNPGGVREKGIGTLLDKLSSYIKKRC